MALPFTTQRLKQILGYPKCQAGSLKILLLSGQYLVENECQGALRALGHQVVRLAVDVKAPVSDVVAQLLGYLIKYKPDCVLSINHFGFDHQGQVGALLSAIEMPCAVWYVDSPLFILGRDPKPFLRSQVLFVWDDAYAPVLRTLGAEAVFYLPLAADSRLLRSRLPQHNPDLPAAFVGSSGHLGLQPYLADLTAAERAQKATWQSALLRQRRHAESLLREGLAWRQGKLQTLTAAVLDASLQQRLALVTALQSLPLTVFGDSSWPQLIAGLDYRGAVPYGPKLALAYRRAAVQLNITSLQMPRAVNQRVFDVPGAGGFLLTDAQPDLQRLFNVERECAVYHSREEAQELAAYYAKHPSLRTQVTAAARARIIKEHTYEQRMQTLLAAVRRHYGSCAA